MTCSEVRAVWFALVISVFCNAGIAGAETSPAEQGVNAWLTRMHEASRLRAYTGTFVVSAGAKTASAKI